jgi:hypothetical protein
MAVVTDQLLLRYLGLFRYCRKMRAGQCRGHIRYVKYVSVVLLQCRLCVAMKQWLAMNVFSFEEFQLFLQIANSGL